MPTVRLADYRPAVCLINRTDLTVRLFDDHAEVEAQLAFEPNPAASPGPLELRGLDLTLLELRLDGEELAPDAYRLSDDGLVIAAPPRRPFLLQSRVRIHPHTNTTLEGLYESGGMLATQCEAEGFRRITFHPDRPDLLSRFRVRIEADQQTCPVLLSNGNCVDTGLLSGEDGAPPRHYAVWDDPFPKPSYLFALVAGRLEEVQDTFTTASGRPVRLRLHVEPGDAPYTAHAMASLQRAMRWDEQRYGLEYDLEEFNIVAVRHFNMGAMENKSLNIFNSKLVLADAETATDAELERIESVVAHEYFHNWTGNRITCRDWFQLSLKEGLTVFRDQSFSADLHGLALNRIENVAVLRNTQFREDAGPTAHPVQPDAYQAIDNFYTTTIYEKGSELIRMLHTLLGEDTFMEGMALYVRRHDGSAATCDDFVQAMQDAAEAAWAREGVVPAPFEFAQFRRWYHQAGTPVLTIHRHWDGTAGVLELTVEQHTPPTPGQPEKQPLVIPLALGLVDQAGQALPVQLEGEQPETAAAERNGAWGAHTRLLVIDQPRQQLRLVGLPPQAHPPALSLLRQFSAPVKLEMGRTTAELVHLLAHDSEAFARWDAAQGLVGQAVQARAAGHANEELEELLIAAFGRILADPLLSEGSRAALLSLPGLAELEDASDQPDPPALFAALLALQRRFGEALAEPLQASLERCRPAWPLAWPEGSGARRLTGTIWAWRAAAGDPAVIQAAREAVDGGSMTLARAGLRALQCLPIAARQEAVDAFYRRWQEKPVILDAWFALEASAPFPDGLERVERLLHHPRFDPAAPNSVRAVLGGLAGNPPVFHAIDGAGYRFMAHQIAALDQRNPITASRMAKVFSRWQSYGPERRERMRQALTALASGTLSTNTREVVEQCLATELSASGLSAAAR
ncbi:aminopeptidase N [Cyanobium sp. PCC 7001]|uniref:aminopeptidase N n=1 Tax=Cyanobium sp. PCC 7001 TaxID=180281 RepID=UPI0001805187|nr:aminopeptidase N [Cyanobium sp. PCC 7001]EDY37249.1 aminopeptidase N [Cyanobium sp. PCC 7001]